MNQKITTEPLLRRLAQAKLEGVTVREMHKQLAAEGVAISTHWLAEVWAKLPKRVPITKRGAATKTPAASPEGQAFNSETAAPAVAFAPRAAAAAPSPRPALPVQAQAALQPTPAAMETGISALPSMSFDEALSALEKVLQDQYDQDWSIAKCQENGDDNAVELLVFCASLRASMSPTKLDQKDEFAGSALKTLNDFYPARAAGQKGVGTILRAWLRDEALRFPKFI